MKHNQRRTCRHPFNRLRQPAGGVLNIGDFSRYVAEAGCFFLLTSDAAFLDNGERRSSLETRKSGAVVRRGFRETKATSKTKAGVITSPSGEIERDEFNETCKSPKWFPRLRVVSGLRCGNRSAIPSTSRSECQSHKETMPGNAGRTDLRSPANSVAQEPTQTSLLRSGKHPE